MPEHTLILLGAPRLLGDLLARALATAPDVHVIVRDGAGTDINAVLGELAADPIATVVTLGAEGHAAVAWRLTRSLLDDASADDLLAAARGA